MTIRNYVAFRSEFFAALDREHGELTAGHALGEHLAAQLQAQGFTAEVWEEDGVAWKINCELDRRFFWVIVSDSGDEQDRWLVVITPLIGCLPRLFGVRSTDEMKTLCAQVHRILSADARIGDVRWYGAGEWNSTHSEGSPTPD